MNLYLGPPLLRGIRTQTEVKVKAGRRGPGPRLKALPARSPLCLLHCQKAQRGFWNWHLGSSAATYQHIINCFSVLQPMRLYQCKPAEHQPCLQLSINVTQQKQEIMGTLFFIHLL